MDFNEKELSILFKAIKIMESGEELLGIDINKEVIHSLVDKFLKKIDNKSAKKIDKEIIFLIKEARKFSQSTNYGDYNEKYSDNFDREFGPSYPYSNTLKLLNQAIKDNKTVEINYYSTSQRGFTRRKVKPKNIERRSGTPYLNAFCYLRNDDRIFKIGRIKNIKIINNNKK